MPCIHNQPLCYGKNKFSQDDLKSRPDTCKRCKQTLYPEDVCDLFYQLIDCVRIIKVSRNSRNDRLFG